MNKKKYIREVKKAMSRNMLGRFQLFLINISKRQSKGVKNEKTN